MCKVLFLLKTVLLFLLATPLYLHAQTKRQEKEFNGFGLLRKITTYTPLGANKEEVQIVEYAGDESKVLYTLTYFTLKGKKEGEEKYYSTSTYLLYTNTYANGVLHGPSVRYHPNGRIQYKYNYVNGKREGEVITYTLEGTPFSAGKYVNDEQEGEWVHYYPNGKTKSKGDYKNGKREGIWRGYFEDGALEYVRRYINGDEDTSFITTEIVSTPCPNPKKLRGLCMYVGSRDKEPDAKGPYIWRYQTKLFEAACVDVTKDSKEEIGRKIAAAMKQYEDILVCSNTQFDISQGNIIKYAVNMKFDEFIYDMCEWKVDFNKVDAFDGHTVLDYIQVQIARNKGLASEPILKRYYDMIQKAGGKHKSEL